METVITFILQYKSFAPWIAFALPLLSGCNIPISTDAVMIACAIIAATLIPEKTYAILFALLLGTYFAGWASYWIGRLLGPKITKLPLLRKLFTEEKLSRMRTFYTKRGLITLIIGRFIPFGVRNCLFISTGMSKSSFPRFALRDALAATIWTLFMFTLFYHLGANMDRLLLFVKTFNIAIFSLFGVTLITFLWYKKRKRLKQDDKPVE